MYYVYCSDLVFLKKFNVYSLVYVSLYLPHQSYRDLKHPERCLICVHSLSALCIHIWINTLRIIALTLNWTVSCLMDLWDFHCQRQRPLDCVIWSTLSRRSYAFIWGNLIISKVLRCRFYKLITNVLFFFSSYLHTEILRPMNKEGRYRFINPSLICDLPLIKTEEAISAISNRWLNSSESTFWFIPYWSK